jgi:rod shape-determining protein MreC
VKSPRFKRLVLFFFLPLFLYFSIYTWNWKTGHLNYLSTLVGLDLAGWILTPGRWIQHNTNSFWARYIYLVGVRQENEELLLQVHELEFEVLRVAEKAKAADRLASMLRFTPETTWDRRGCRVIGQKLGPNAVLETMLIDVGTLDGVRHHDPVISTKGVVGQILKPGLKFSNVLLLTDVTSRIPVITSTGRIPAIAHGQGSGSFLEIKFIPRNDEIVPGEILLTSGQGGIFPKGIPVARVVEVTPADVSLFQKVYAEPLLNLRYYEELLILSRRETIDPLATNGTILDNPEGNDNASAKDIKPPTPNP